MAEWNRKQGALDSSKPGFLTVDNPAPPQSLSLSCMVQLVCAALFLLAFGWRNTHTLPPKHKHSMWTVSLLSFRSSACADAAASLLVYEKLQQKEWIPGEHPRKLGWVFRICEVRGCKGANPEIRQSVLHAISVKAQTLPSPKENRTLAPTCSHLSVLEGLIGTRTQTEQK